MPEHTKYSIRRWFVWIFFLCVFLPATPGESTKSEALSSNQALEVAQRTSEAKALQKLLAERETCIEAKVVRPCDSQWVTCIEDAWVVFLNVKEECAYFPEKRLGLVIVVSDKDGEIISRYPEMPYLKDAVYCLHDDDCVATANDASQTVCMNFIHAPLRVERKSAASICECSMNVCE